MSFILKAGFKLGMIKMKRLIFFVLSTRLFIMSCGRDLTGPSSGPALGIISEIQLEHSLDKILDFFNGHLQKTFCAPGKVNWHE